MTPKLTLALLTSSLLVPVAGCGSQTANPISTGGSSSASSTGETTGTHGATGTGASSGGTGGSAPAAACEPGCGSGEVCVESACHAVVKLDSSGNTTNCTIALDATNVYWATSEVRLVPKAGGQPTSFGAWVSQPALAVDDTYMYFNAGNGGIERGEKSGNSGFEPFAGETVLGPATHIASDGSAVYYMVGATETEPPAVYETPTTGTLVDPTMVPTVFATNLYGIGSVAVDAASVYYFGGGGLVKQDKTTQATTPLASEGGGFDLNIGDSAGIVVDGDTVYYSTSPVPGSGAVVAKVSGAGGASTVVVDATTGPSGVFAVDADSVYFMTVSGVMKVSKTGGSPVMVSPLDPPSPFATCMAVDDTYVYWVDGDDLMQYKK